MHGIRQRSSATSAGVRARLAACAILIAQSSAQISEAPAQISEAQPPCVGDFELWQSSDRSWCCRNRGIACDAFDCSKDVDAAEIRWSSQKLDWCCRHRNLGCGLGSTTRVTTEPPFDCNAGWGLWEMGWSATKKRWCCQQTRRACNPWDCRAGLETFATTWTPEKKKWCCEKEYKGCTTTTTTLSFDCNTSQPWQNWLDERKKFCCAKVGTACGPYDCFHDLKNAEYLWGHERKQYCCQNHGKGCFTTPDPVLYDCADGGSTWDVKWPKAKKDWCCLRAGRGCTPWNCESFVIPWTQNKSAYCCFAKGINCTTTTRMFFYDCNKGYDDWESWNLGKKNFCCRSMGRACQAFRCEGTTVQVNSWTKEKKRWCCTNEGKFCEVTTTAMPYDCNQAADAWEIWADDKKQWCCHTIGKGCLAFDCTYQNKTWKTTWSEHKMQFCCTSTGTGCTTSTTTPLFDCRKDYNHRGLWSEGKAAFCCATRGICGYDCEQDVYTWSASWDDAKKQWCCQHRGVGCTTTTYHPPYDCDAGYDARSIGWSPQKLMVCCDLEGKGCAYTKKPEDQVDTSIYDCDANFAFWETRWSAAKQVECCQREGKACDPFDCTQGDTSEWVQAKIEFCREEAGLAPRTTSTADPFPNPWATPPPPPPTIRPMMQVAKVREGDLPEDGHYDCLNGVLSKELWSVKKKQYCCRTTGVACENYECEHRRMETWSRKHRAWCCTSKGVGCLPSIVMDTGVKAAVLSRSISFTSAAGLPVVPAMGLAILVAAFAWVSLRRAALLSRHSHGYAESDATLVEPETTE